MVLSEDSAGDLGGDGIDYSGHFATSNMFKTDLEAIAWARKIANGIGFDLIISSHKQSGKKKLLKCSRGTRYRGIKRDLNSAVRKNTKTKKCNCTFEIIVQQFQGSGSWGIHVSSGSKGMHNHPLAVYPKGYRQMIGLSAASKKIVREMTLAQAKPIAILAAIQEQHPEDNANIKHVYNYKNRLRKFEGLEDELASPSEFTGVTVEELLSEASSQLRDMGSGDKLASPLEFTEVAVEDLLSEASSKLKEGGSVEDKDAIIERLGKCVKWQASKIRKLEEVAKQSHQTILEVLKKNEAMIERACHE